MAVAGHEGPSPWVAHQYPAESSRAPSIRTSEERAYVHQRHLSDRVRRASRSRGRTDLRGPAPVYSVSPSFPSTDVPVAPDSAGNLSLSSLHLDPTMSFQMPSAPYASQTGSSFQQEPLEGYGDHVIGNENIELTRFKQTLPISGV